MTAPCCTSWWRARGQRSCSRTARSSRRGRGRPSGRSSSGRGLPTYRLRPAGSRQLERRDRPVRHPRSTAATWPASWRPCRCAGRRGGALRRCDRRARPGRRPARLLTERLRGLVLASASRAESGKAGRTACSPRSSSPDWSAGCCADPKPAAPSRAPSSAIGRTPNMSNWPVDSWRAPPHTQVQAPKAVLNYDLTGRLAAANLPTPLVHGEQDRSVTAPTPRRFSTSSHTPASSPTRGPAAFLSWSAPRGSPRTSTPSRATSS